MARGTIERRTGKRGTSYRVRVEIDRDPITGKRRWHSETTATRRAAETALAKLVHQQSEGTYRPASKLTVGEYLDQWYAVARTGLRPGTGVRYASTIRLHFKPAFGRVPLGKLTPQAIQQLYQRLLADDYAVGTISVMHGILHVALDRAVKWELIQRNPCDGVAVPKRADPPGVAWSAEDARAFLTATADDKDAALWHLAVTTGMRRGELLGLMWADIDLTEGSLRVRHALARQWDLGYDIAEPKTDAGKRGIMLSRGAVAALMRQQDAQALRRQRAATEGWEWLETGLVFDCGDGGHIPPNAISKRFVTLVKGLGLPPIHLHDLRHTAATLLMAAGVNPRVAQDRLGHATLGMTLGRYSHVTDAMRREASTKLEAILSADHPPVARDRTRSSVP